METVEATVQSRVLVVEDYKPFLDFVCSTLRQCPNLQVIGEAKDGYDAVIQADALRPDLLLLDIGLPGLNGMEVAHRVRHHSPKLKIIFLTQESSEDIVREAFGLGAVAYVLKGNAARDLPVALETVLQGKKFASRGVDRDVLSRPEVA
jgi:DNA-binding NarL/FixJ family response regulator